MAIAQYPANRMEENDQIHCRMGMSQVPVPDMTVTRVAWTSDKSCLGTGSRVPYCTEYHRGSAKLMNAAFGTGMSLGSNREDAVYEQVRIVEVNPERRLARRGEWGGESR